MCFSNSVVTEFLVQLCLALFSEEYINNFNSLILFHFTKYLKAKFSEM